MEEDDLEMGMFGDGKEIVLNTNFNFNPDDDTQDDEINTDEDQEMNNDTAEEDSPGEVGSEEDDQDEGGNEDNDSDSSSNLYSSLATVIHEQGLLPSLDIDKDKITSIEDFTNVLKREQEIQAQAKLEEYLANLDISQIAQSKKVIEDLNNIDEIVLKDNIDLAKNIIYEDYINQGLSKDKASKMLKRLIDLGEDAILEDATESLTSLKEFETRKIEEEKNSYIKRLEEEKIEQANLDKKIKETVYESKEILKGFKANKTIQDKVYKSITEIVGKSPDGTFENKFMRERRENPIEFETRMYYMYELTNGFKDYSKIATSAKSKAVDDLEKIVRKSTNKDNGTPLFATDSNSYDSNKTIFLNL